MALHIFSKNEGWKSFDPLEEKTPQPSERKQPSRGWKNLEQPSEVLLVSFVLSTINYSSMAILGYLMYGGSIESQITLSLPQHKIDIKIAIFTSLINPLAKYGSIMYPIAHAIEDSSPVCTTRIMSITIRTLLLVTTLIVAMSISFFAYVMAFIGSFAGVVTSILISCMCYLKINHGMGKLGWELMFIVLIMVTGSSIGVVGTYTSIKEVIKRL
ncbi:amino acid transporter AVT1I-like [Benincasa hispida]|uniref:amino acid transporter AVT1I-like n=1 Tax=Benincasa hispida TaxID=102211 RepID=UPI001900BA1A|nr:amino acid transporter AVT1I-like [Benincasa hispida]